MQTRSLEERLRAKSFRPDRQLFALYHRCPEETRRMGYPTGRSTEWQPSRTWVFAVGVLSYHGWPRRWKEKDRRDSELIAALRDRGVPSKQIRFIKNKKATGANVVAAFSRFLSRLPSDATLWFYFAGHGHLSQRTGIASFRLYDHRLWRLPSLIDSLEQKFTGAQAMLFADCCYSGSLAHAALSRTASVPCAVLTSTQPSESSTDEWTFTEGLISALRGTAARPGGRPKSVLDVAQYVQRRLALLDGQFAGFVCTNDFDPGLVLASVRKPRKRLTASASGKAASGRG